MPKKLFKLFVIILALAFLLTAYFIISLPLTFEVDGKTYVTVITTGRKAIKMPEDPVKEGYVFDGWYWDKDVWEQPFTNALSDTPIRKSATVYAKWKQEAHVHSFGEWTVTIAATCTAEGSEKRVCECGEAETRVIEKLPHNFGEWAEVTPSTCTAEGTEKRVCECGETETRAIEKIPHNFGEWAEVTPSTCTAEGTEKRVCECGEAETRAIAKLAHPYEGKHDTEYHWKECTDCHEVIDKAAHRYGEWTVETDATCTAEGLEKSVCECGLEETRITEKLPHSFGEWTVITAATCTAEGTEKRVCECGEVETRTIEIKAHDYITKYDQENHWSECSVCNDKKDEAAHTYENDVCTVCGSEYVTIGLKYKEVSGGYEVAGIGTVKESRIVIPSTYEGEPVIGIGDRAFNRCNSLVSVVIPDSVTSIGNRAFYYCRSLVSVEIPSGVTSIGTYAFNGCRSLTKVEISDIEAWCGIEFVDRSSNPLATAKHLYINGEEVTELVIPEGVTSIGNYAFSDCSSLVSVVIPNSVTSIGDNAFRDCSSLVSVEIPSGVTYIGDYTFYYCSSLVSVEIPSSVTSIGSNAFNGCGSVETITVAEGNTKYYSEKNCLIETETKTLIAGCKNSIIPTDGSVTSIGDSAFIHCTSLVSVKIPSSVTSIGSGAFSGCSSLVSVVIPNSVTSVGDSAFSNCRSLTKVEISDIAAWCGIEFGNLYANPLYYAKHLYLNGEEVTELVIPEGVTSIGAYAFSSCSSLVSIVIPNSVTSIGDRSFSSCSSLVSVEIPSSVTSIGNYAFSDCSSLVSVEIPSGVTYIGDHAFSFCGSLESIVYGGTKAEWKDKITKGDTWNYNTGNYTVTCTDGTLTK